MTMTWFMRIGMDPSCLGLLPDLVSDEDPRPAREQFDENYQGGWNPSDSFTFNRVDMTLVSKYPEDPVLHVIAGAPLRNELIYLFPCDLVVISQQDGSFEVARMT